MFETFLQDIRFGARMLRKNPGFTAVAVLTLALGIGANAAIFSLVNGVLLRPLPYSQPDRLVTLWQIGIPKGALLALQEKSRTMDVTGYTFPVGSNLSSQGQPMRLTVSRVTPNLFQMLGVNADLGRTFQSGEQDPANSHVAILSHALWQRLYGSDVGVIGKWLTLEGTAVQIVGVMPAGFRFPSPETELWLPITVAAGGQGLWADFGHLPVARLRPGVSLAQANAEYKTLVPQIVKTFPWPMPAHYAEWTNVVPMQESLVGELQTKFFLLLGAVGLVMLIACANVANLLLTRSAARQKEIAVRAALGAGRMRLAGQLLTECLLIACAGGVLGLLLAQGGLVLLKSALPADTPRLAEVSLDWRVLLFVSGMVLLTGLGFGLAPAWRAARVDMEQTLRGSSQKSGVGRGRRRLSSALVVSEAALMVVLLVGAGLLLKSLWRLSHVGTGFRTDHVVTALVTPNGAFCAQGDGCVSFFNEVRKQVGAIPGVESVALADNVPFNGAFAVALAVENRQEFTSASPFNAWSFQVSPGLLQTLGIPLMAGRDFLDTDRAGAPGVVLVSRAMADKLWPGQNPLGRHVKPSWVKDWRTVVGVVGDVREYSLFPDGADQHVFGDIYLPAAQGIIAPIIKARLVVRAAGDMNSIVASLRGVVAGVRSDVPISEVRTMDEILSRSVSGPRSTTSLFVLFALLALTLGCIGIYSVVSYSVSERTQEIGIRVAVGAQKTDVLKLVIGGGMKLAGIGMGIGLAGAAALTRLMESLLFGVKPVDAATYLGVVALLSVLAMLACYIPARRALRLDPVVALRCE
ncbi:MAG TPA: ABC transporter permease [Candidatus Limnocylindrales bacterium]|nr:ABC transporter permease [Candidatus Limnocylindrales bacterium]